MRDGETTANGTTYRIHATEPPSLFGPYDGVLSAVESWNQTVAVEPDGRLRWLRIEFTGEAYVDSETVAVTGSYDVRFSAVGVTAVERPDRVRTALNETRERRTDSLKRSPAQAGA